MKNKFRQEKGKNNLISFIHLLILFAILFFIMRSVFFVGTGWKDTGHFFSDFWGAVKAGSLAEWYTFIGAGVIVLIGMAGVYEYGYLNNMSFLVPPSYVSHKETSMLKSAQKMMELYYRKDIDFIKTYEEKRLDTILQTLMLTQEQFNQVRYEFLRVRANVYDGLDSMQKAAKDLFLHREFIIDLTSLDPCDRVYHDVNYYLNLYSALYDKKLCEDAARLMYNFLDNKLKNDLGKIDCFIVPQGSNLLLALEVGRRTGIPIASVQYRVRTKKGDYLDGIYKRRQGGGEPADPLDMKPVRIAILHDVLVSGGRIIESLEKLPGPYELMGVFSIIHYVRPDNKEFKKFRQDKRVKDKLHCILALTEDEVRQIYEREASVAGD